MDAMLYWGIALLGVALLLAVIEVFLPTAGLLPVVAAVVAVAGVVCLFRASATWGLIGSLIVIVGGPASFFIGLRVMPNTPLGRRLVLTDTSRGPRGGDGDVATAADTSLSALVGREGLVATDLRPIGTVKIDGHRYDAISDSGLLRAGSTVRVLAVEGAELRVRPRA